MKLIIGFCGDWDKSQKTKGKAFAPFLEPFLAAVTQHQILRINRENSKINYWRTWKISIPLNFFTRWIQSKKRKNVRFWHLVFRLLRPRCVFAIEPTPEMCYLAQKYKTKLVEILHFYGLDSSDPKYGLAFEKRQHRLFRPEYNVVFDEKSYQTRKEIDHLHGSKSFLCKPLIFLPQIPKNQVRPQILYTCQWGYDGEYPFLNGILKNGFIPEVILETIKKDESIKWLIKLHPVQIQSPKKSKYISILQDSLGKEKNWQWQKPSSHSIWENLSQVDLHVTMSSATVYEAAFVGINSLALCPSLLSGGIYQNHYSELVEKGYLEKINLKTTGLKQKVDLGIKKKPKPLVLQTAKSPEEILHQLLHE